MRALVVLAAFALPAQTPPVLVRLTVVGPEGWRAQLGPTNLGSMLATERAEAIWRGHAAAIDAALQQARGDDELFATQRARFLDYGGLVQVTAWLEQAEDSLHLPRWSAALVAEGDGRTDLAAMAAECRVWLAGVEGAVATPWRQMQLLAPRVHEGRLIAVLACAEDMAAAAARAERLRAVPLERGAILRLELAVEPFLGLLRDRAAERDLVATLLGPATRSVSLAIGRAGPRVALDLGLHFGAGGRGVPGGLHPVRAGAPDLAWLVPDGTGTHYAWRLDAPALWDTVVEAYATVSERDLTKVGEELKLKHGCDLGKLLGLLEDQAVLLWRSNDDTEDDDPSLLANACLVVPVRDEKAFGEGVEALVKKVQFANARDDDGTLKVQLPSCSLTIGKGVCCIAFGHRGDDQVAAVLDRAAAGRPKPLVLAPPIGAPPGWNARGRIDVTTLAVRDIYGQLRWGLYWLMAMQRLPKVIAAAKEAERWLPLLREHRLDQATTLGGVTAEASMLRILW